MRRWQRVWSYSAVTVMWLLSSLGITWAQGAEIRNQVKNQSDTKISPNAPVYLMPYAISSALIDGGQPATEMRHYSHRSHSSHYSHRSHSSHYSGSSDSGPSSSSSGSSTTSVVVDTMDIRTVQRKLNDMGYDAGTVDGIKGQRTIDAIKKFQEHYGLDVDGIVGTKSKQALDTFSLVTVQRKLKELGYNCDTFGTRDEKTIEALKRFQSDCGLENDAIVNMETKKQLDSISLMDVQKKLKELGYSCDANGIRDDRTIKAIMGFQQKNALEVNGVINKATRDALGL